MVRPYEFFISSRDISEDLDFALERRPEQDDVQRFLIDQGELLEFKKAAVENLLK